jgi:hypothetical protein
VGECESGKHEDDLKPSEEFMSGAKSLINSCQSLHLQGFSRIDFAAAAENGYTCGEHGRR